MQAAFTHAIKFVADMDAAIAFYRDVMGLKLRFASPGWSEFETGAVTLALHPVTERNPAGTVELGFTAPDLAATYAGRDAERLSFTGPPKDLHGRLIAHVLDSEGAEVSLSGA
jgi:catechol 2,3-dioxygenase-like lactoylglutathione lyase family enzyme